ncbi:hypothetical protein PJ593_002259 [Klebsiella aerogenes]
MPNAKPKTKANNEPYRKVKITMWDDPKFRALSPLPPSGQSLFIYLLTSPFTGIIPGLFKAGRAAMAEELNWDVEDFDLALDEALSLGLVKADLQARVFWLPNAAKHNPPASVNVIKSWANAFNYLPESPLKWEAWEALKAACYGVSKAMGEAFEKVMPMPKYKPTPLPSGIQKAVSSKQILKDTPLNPPEGKAGKNKFDPLSVELPEWLSPALWAEWVDYRKQLGKPIKTQQGVSGSINKLSAYRDKGHSPEYVVRLTMENEWRGLIVPEGMTSNKPRDVNAISQPDGFIPKGFRG